MNVSNRASLKVILLFGLVVFKESYSQEDRFAYKYQNYKENDGRMQVLAHYAHWDVSLSETVRLKLTGLTDALSGASPTGVQPDEPGGEIPFSTLPKEVRKSAIVDLNWEKSEVTSWAGQFSYSSEPDYRSMGLSLSGLYYRNKQNTTLRYGVSYIDDEVKASPSDTDKNAVDAIVGVTQILTPTTVLTVNLSAGYAYGYLADPYKGVGRTESFSIPGFPDRVINYYESRPDERVKGIFYSSIQHYVKQLKGSVDASYRFYLDDWDIQSHTISLNWRQWLGAHIVVEPILRYYNQSAASFYRLTLDGTGIDPNSAFDSAIPDGKGPYYSGDYRLSKFEATTVGIKLNWFATDRFKFDIAYEVYEINGKDDTPAAAYPTAKTYTLGVSYVF